MKVHRRIIYLAGFLFSVPLALTSYINSSFLKGYVNENYVGILYAVASLITIFGMLRMPKLLERIGNRQSSLLLSLLCFVSLLALSFGKSLPLAIGAFVVYFVTSNLLMTSLDIFIESFSTHKTTGTLRGVYLTIINLAWVISQTVSGSIIAKSSFAD